MAVGVGRAVAQRALTPGADSGLCLGGWCFRRPPEIHRALVCAVAQRSGQTGGGGPDPARSRSADRLFGLCDVWPAQRRQPKAGPSKLNTLGVVNVERSGPTSPTSERFRTWTASQACRQRVRLAQDSCQVVGLGTTRMSTNDWRIGTYVWAGDGGHEILPIGGHRNAPLVATVSPHGWPSFLPTVLS
jgi:hypothetical protein